MKTDINGKLKSFNKWWDEFILEAIKPVAILSMGLGTVAVFNLQGLAVSPWFVALWAVVQAMSIDGLFFATWDRLFSQKLKWSNALAIFGLAFIGLVLALIAIAINAILGFQVLWAIADSQTAMTRLGISSELFTVIRAVLAVVVFIFISFVRARARSNEEANTPTTLSPQKAKSLAKVTVREAKPLALPEVASSHEEANQEIPVIDILRARPESRYELIKAAMAKAIDNGEKLNLKAIADETGAGYSTVKLYAPKIKQELQGGK